mmetsp:Transcript_19783/g.54961  ORF Transcript_19783/g.54961 Transcript_19783/m.54961 type:complete len:836 (+) Transcript_19783:441-2948(+)|eukprot:CAMPEP_0117668184 /NCGR_PEP_ID=MMETSP0804-20121206/11398_1 /TAXON_ID=1074897 /ORGANISM="Tetraselmis astigmatica, Strain CCMP880" /LENGTH=835 /DNA_ID=CAMNT_0005476027 /DNA_START=154 /DNA_END=2661 /DNA_ORIENTATION=-
MPQRASFCGWMRSLLWSLLCLSVRSVHGAQPAADGEATAAWDFSSSWRNKEAFLQETERSAHHLLHKTTGSGVLTIPAEVNVVLVGFSGDGGYHYKVDAISMQNLLSERFPAITPTVLGTGRSTCVNHRLKYNVAHAPQGALKMLETVMKANLQKAQEETGSGSDAPEPGRTAALFEVDASRVEAAFDLVFRTVMEGSDPAWERRSPLFAPLATNDSAILIVNFDKLRIDPRLPAAVYPEGGEASLTESWDAGDLTTEQLELQEGNYAYRYNYAGRGSSMTWIAKNRYVVIDVSSGPTAFGPIGDKASGTVTPLSVPRLQSVLRRSNTAVELQPPGSLRTKALLEAIHVRDAVFRGELASLIYGAAQHVIIPDIQISSSSTKKRVMVPLVVLRDHEDFDPLSDDASDAPEFARLWGPRRLVDQGAIRSLATSLLRAGQQLIMPATTLFLHEHRMLASALAKATAPSGGHGGSLVDGEALLDEFRAAADALTAGLIQDPDTMTDDDLSVLAMAAEGSQTGEEHSARLLQGTRVVPVFVLSLKAANPGLAMKGGGSFVAASGDMVIILQVRQPSSTGHLENGRPVVVDGLDVTLSVAAGVAVALGGIAPPHLHYSHAHGSTLSNLLWSVGHHPFGPYANTSGVSWLMVDAAHRNLVLSRVAGALTYIDKTMSELKAFALDYMSVLSLPDEDGFLEEADLQLGNPGWWETLYRDSTKQQPPLPHDVVGGLEEKMDRLEEEFVSLSRALWSHNFEEAERVSGQLHFGASRMWGWATWHVEQARRQLQCCQLLHEVPQAISPVVMYALLLCLGALAYAVVLWYSAMLKQQKFNRLLSGSM